MISPELSPFHKLLERVKHDVKRVLNMNLKLTSEPEATIIVLNADGYRIRKEHAASTSIVIQQSLDAVTDRICDRINQDDSLRTSASTGIRFGGKVMFQRPELSAIIEEELEREESKSAEGGMFQAFSSLPVIFESFPQWVTDYQDGTSNVPEHLPYIFMVMHVDRASIDRFEVIDHSYGDTGLPHTHSLILSVMDVLRPIVQEYASKGPRKMGRSVFGSPQHIVDYAAIELMQKVLDPYVMNENIIIRLDEIAAQNYEGAQACGSILVVNHANLEAPYQVRFLETVAINSVRKVRKLLEICDGTRSLIADNDLNIYGVDIAGSNSEARYRDSLAKILFTGHYQWDLIVKGKTLMQVSYGRPRLPRPRIEREEISAKVASALRSPNMELLTDIIHEAAQQKKGTMLVISSEAEREAQRLGGAGTRIFPSDISSSISSVTKIDGAVLLDPAGQCYGIGMILDGIIPPEDSNEEGKESDSARGARYNSSVRYRDLRKRQDPIPELLVVVISEDGMIDWLTIKDDPKKVPAEQ